MRAPRNDVGWFDRSTKRSPTRSFNRRRWRCCGSYLFLTSFCIMISVTAVWLHSEMKPLKRQKMSVEDVLNVWWQQFFTAVTMGLSLGSTNCCNRTKQKRQAQKRLISPNFSSPKIVQVRGPCRGTQIRNFTSLRPQALQEALFDTLCKWVRPRGSVVIFWGLGKNRTN